MLCVYAYVVLFSLPFTFRVLKLPNNGIVEKGSLRNGQLDLGVGNQSVTNLVLGFAEVHLCAQTPES